MKQILDDRADFVFFIKLLPLKIHPAAYNKAKVITCEKSIRLLERAFDGKTIPTEPRCETTEVDETIELAEKLNITGTPSVVLPDGAVVGGAMEAEDLIDMIVKAGMAVYEEEAFEADAKGEVEEVIEGDSEEPEDAEDSEDSEEPEEGDKPDKEAGSSDEDDPEEIDIKIKKVQ